MDKADPYLKKAFMEVVDNQLRDNDPPKAREAFDRLVSEGISEEDAKLYLSQAVCIEVWDTMKNGKEFDLGRYERNLDRLPDVPAE